jgi:hypothetical protein
MILQPVVIAFPVVTTLDAVARRAALERRLAEIKDEILDAQGLLTRLMVERSVVEAELRGLSISTQEDHK